jgi:hypothetical protein
VKCASLIGTLVFIFVFYAMKTTGARAGADLAPEFLYERVKAAKLAAAE